jgi:serine/threonine protein kinase
MATPSNHGLYSSAADAVRLALRFAGMAAPSKGDFESVVKFGARDISRTSTVSTRSAPSSLGSSFESIDLPESDPHSTDLQAFHKCKVFEDLPTGFTMIRKISKGINGDIFEYSWSRCDELQRVAVKQLRNATLDRDGAVANERQAHFGNAFQRVACPEDPLAEIGVLTYLARQPDLSANLLRLHGVFADATKPITWLVTELAEGGELFDVAASGRPVAEADIRRYGRQLFGAVCYLHTHYIGHRDVSMENILLKEDNVKLMDFGMSVQSHSTVDGVELRYFRAVGKDNYRAPECYCPATEYVTVTPDVDAVPNEVSMVKASGGLLCAVKLPADATAGKVCRAEVWGYAATPVDIFSSGICMFILLCKFPPWQNARLTDPTFSFAHRNGDKGLQNLLQHWKKPVPSSEAMDLLSNLLQADPSKRPSASAVLASPWFCAESDEKRAINALGVQSS